VTIASACEQDEVAREFFLSAYTSPLCMEIIRENDKKRAMEVFREYCTDWTDERFVEAETLVSGLEYSTLMTTGAMGDYRFVAQRPWNNFIDSITKVVIESGVTSVGNNAFNGCSNLTEVVLPDTVTSIGTRAFYICVAVTNFEYKEIAE